MSINSQKFLPPSKIGSSTSIIKVEKISPSLYKNTSSLKSKSGDVGGELLVIKTKVIDISNLVSSTALLKKKTEKENRKEKEQKKREEKENKLEKKDNKLIPKLPSFNLPKLGFLDAINRFITFTLLGWVFKRIYPYLPQILDFIKKIDPVIKFVEVLAGNFFKGVVDFIDFGYKAHDTVRDFTKKIGGENLQKTFDDFTKNLNTFVNLAIIAGMLSTGGPNFGRPKGGPRGGKPGKGGDWRTEGNVIKGKGGFKQAYDNMLKKGNLTKGEQRVVRDYKRLVKAGYHPDSAANQAFFRNRPEWLSGRNVRGGGFSVETAKDYRTAAKGNVVKPKLRLSFGKGIFGRVPIIGGLLDFAFSLAMGEPVGRAAAKSVGSTLGSALGTLIPIPFAGTILGGILGDIVGGALYDTLTANKPKKMAGGGKVTTRKGKVVGGKIKRTVRRVTAPSKAKQVKPGTSVGGEKKVKQIYPEPPKQQVGKMMNPYGFLTKTTKDMGSIPFLGPIFNIFGKTLLGDSPTKDDYKIIGSSINSWINNAISKGVLQGNLMSAFADGGVIDIESEMKRNISGWVEKSVDELVRNKVTAAINELRKNLGLKQLMSGSGDNIPSTDSGNVELRGNVASKSVQVAKYLMSKYGLTNIQASAIVGVLLREGFGKGRPDDIEDSYGTFGPPPIGTDRVGYGWAQWTNVGSSKRLDNIARAIGVTDRPWTDMDNLRALDWEITNNSTYKKGLEELKKQSDIEKATEVWADYFEAGGYPGALVRNYGRAKLNDRIGSARAVLRRVQTGKDDEGRPLEQAVISPGSMGAGDGRFIQGNSGDSDGVHFHVGTTKSGDSSGSTAAAFRVIKHFLGKKSVHIGRSRENIPTGATDDQIRGYIARGMAAHATRGRGPTEIDIQVGGAYGQGNKVPFPLALKNLTYSETSGYGTRADIVGVNAFVGHGRYKPDGSLAKQQGTVLSSGAPDYYYKRGGQIGEEKVKPLQKQASYEEGPGSMIYILPIRIKEQVPVPMQNNRTNFPGGLNRSMSSRVPMR